MSALDADKTQRLLSWAVWDTVAAMGWYAGSLWQAWIKPPAARPAVAAIDETGQVKQGATARVKRH